MDDRKQPRSPSLTKNADTLACDRGFGKAKNFKKMRFSRSRKIQKPERCLPPAQSEQLGLSLYPQILWIRLCILVK